MEIAGLGAESFLMISLGNIKNDYDMGSSVALAPCDPRFTILVNRAQSRLAQMGRWWGTFKKLRLCITQNCITWPAGVINVEGFNICGITIPVRNGWYDFQDIVRTPKVGQCSCDENQLLDRGMTPQYRDPLVNSYIKIYAVSSTDYGKKVLIQGNDNNGNPIRNSDAGGWFQGEKLTLAVSGVTSSAIFSPPGIIGAQKPITNSYLNVFAVNSVTLEETQIAVWGPGETNPIYRRTALVRLPRSCQNTLGNWCQDLGDGCAAPVPNCTGVVADAMVRMGVIPAVADSDWLLIGNPDAIRSCMKALQAEDKGDYKAATFEQQNAIRFLRNELTAFDPPEKVIVNAETYGYAPIRRVFAGMT